MTEAILEKALNFSLIPGDTEGILFLKTAREILKLKQGYKPAEIDKLLLEVKCNTPLVSDSISDMVLVRLLEIVKNTTDISFNEIINSTKSDFEGIKGLLSDDAWEMICMGCETKNLGNGKQMLEMLRKLDACWDYDLDYTFQKLKTELTNSVMAHGLLILRAVWLICFIAKKQHTSPGILYGKLWTKHVLPRQQNCPLKQPLK